MHVDPIAIDNAKTNVNTLQLSIPYKVMPVFSRAKNSSRHDGRAWFGRGL